MTVASHTLERFRTEPLRGPYLWAVALLVWLAGALYCSGYERLLSGLDNWPGSLIWSAVAVLPWLALFEWSKSGAGAHLLSSPARIAAAIGATAVASIVLGRLIPYADGPWTPVALSALRRLPAAGVSLLLILWSRSRLQPVQRRAKVEPSLASLAPSISWIEAADNYVELHVGDRTVMRRMTMRDAEGALAARGFVRIHRRFLVNRRCIEGIVGSNGDTRVRIAGTELPVGRSYLSRLDG
jgi:hypothetical protein